MNTPDRYLFAPCGARYSISTDDSISTETVLVFFVTPCAWGPLCRVKRRLLALTKADPRHMAVLDEDDGRRR